MNILRVVVYKCSCICQPFTSFKKFLKSPTLTKKSDSKSFLLLLYFFIYLFKYHLSFIPSSVVSPTVLKLNNPFSLVEINRKKKYFSFTMNIFHFDQLWICSCFCTFTVRCCHTVESHTFWSKILINDSSNFLWSATFFIDHEFQSPKFLWMFRTFSIIQPKCSANNSSIRWIGVEL